MRQQFYLKFTGNESGGLSAEKNKIQKTKQKKNPHPKTQAPGGENKGLDTEDVEKTYKTITLSITEV